MAVRIGPARIADQTGTHEPGAIIEFPSPALLDLAASQAVHPETGKRYVELVSAGRTSVAVAAPAPAAAPAPDLTPATTPETT